MSQSTQTSVVHASNPTHADHEPAKLLCTLLEATKTRICVDDGFNLDESQNRSIIGKEYLDHLKPGMVGLGLVSVLAQSMRISFLRGVLVKTTTNG